MRTPRTRLRRSTRRGRGHHTHRYRGLLSTLLTAALGAGLLVAVPGTANASGNTLDLPGGREWVELGANAALFIDGTIAFNDHCAADGEGGVDDFVYPATDVYIVPAGADADGATLVDAGGSANTIVGVGGGLFTGELIAAVYPSGKLGDGEYDIVYDTCQDGKVSESDEIFSDAIVVDVPDGEIPPVDPSIRALKEKARQEYVAWLQMHLGMTALFALEDAKELAACILEANVDCLAEIVLGLWTESDPYSAAVDDFQDQFLSLVANKAQNYGAIWQDPADPQFDRFTKVEPKNVTVPPFVGSPVPDAFAAATEPLAQENALGDALLHALERYQGAQAKGDTEWALTQAKAVRDLSEALDEHLSTDTSLADLRGALASRSSVLDQKLADGRAVINRIRSSGFSPAEQQVLANRGLSRADVRRAEDAFVARGPAYALTTSDLLAQLDAVLAAQQGMQDALAESAQGWDDLVTDLEKRVDQGAPEADAGGPYTTTDGAVTLDGRGSTPSKHSAFVRFYDWDLDGDGEYDDASGSTPEVQVATSRTIGLRVTDDSGFQGVDTARVVVTGGDRAPVVTSADPSGTRPVVTVGTARDFTVTASDPDGDPLTYTWTLDGTEVSATATFGYDPTASDVGAHTLAVTVTGAGKATSRTWVVSVLRPDKDLDGWTETSDCDDSVAVVHPGAMELPGNGVDDDCDAGSPDAPVGGVTGSLWTWGSGVGTGQNTFTDQYTPKPVDLGQPVRAVESTHAGGFAVLEDRTVRSWGQNFDGFVGDGSYDVRRAPVTVPGLSQVKEIAVDGSSVLALRTNGTVVAWGSNLNQQLGDGTTVASRPSPGDVLAPDGTALTGITTVEAGESTSYAVTDDGRVRNWGVVHCDGTAPVEQTTRTNHADINPLFGSGNVQIASGDGGGALARKADGSVWSCNSYTQLNGRPGSGNAAVTPAKIPALSDIVDVAMGDSAAVALDGNGDVWLWGKNLNHTLDVIGLPSGGEQLTPVKVPLPAGPPVVDVETDYAATTYATRADGSVLVWGDNNYGSGGVGNTAYAIAGTPQIALGGGRAIATASSDWNGMAIVRPADDPAYERPAQYLTASVADTTVTEGTTGSAQLTLSAPAPYELDVTYRVGDGPQQAATVAKGATTAALPVSVTDDALDEDDEQLPLQVLSVSHSVPVVGGAAVVTVVDDDAAPSVSIGSLDVAEGSTSLTDVAVPVTLSAPSGKDVAVSWTTQDGTATAPADFAAAHGVATIPAGETSTVLHLSVVGDTVVEPAESLSVALSEPTNAVLGEGTGAVTVSDDEPLAVSVSDAAVAEGDTGTTPATFTISTPAIPAGETVTVPWTVVGGTAETGSDVVAAKGSVELAAGAESADVTVDVVADKVAEALHVETFRLVLGRDLSTSARRPVVADGYGTGRVTDDDVTTSVDAGADVSGTEGSPVAVSGAASAPATWSVDSPLCTVASPGSLATTVTCTDDVVATLTLTADDGVNPVVTDTAKLTVSNVAPTLTITAPAAGSSVTVGRTVAVTTTVSDPGDDAVSCSVAWGDGSSSQGCAPSHTYGAAGDRTIEVTADDGDGGTTVTSVALTVVADVPETPATWPWQGFFAPVDNLPVVNVVKAGSTVPLKFSVGGYRGLAVFAAGSPASGSHSCASSAPADVLEETATPGASELSYDVATGRYQYNWKTLKSWGGQCRTLTLTLADGSVHTAEFRLK